MQPYHVAQDPQLSALRDAGPIVVTGAAGLVGGEVVSLLTELEVPVYAVDVRESPGGPGVHSIISDVADETTLRSQLPTEIGAVIHAGGISGPMVAVDDPIRVAEVNGIGTLRMLEIAREFRCRRFVFVSSESVFGAVRTPQRLTEEHPSHPSSVYGAMKVAGEALVDAYRSAHGMSAVSARPVHVYGTARITQCPIAEMIALADTPGEHRYPVGADDARDYVYVTDVARALLHLVIAAEPLRSAYNITGNSHHTAAEVARAVEAEFDGARIIVGDDIDPYRSESGGLDGTAILTDVGFEPVFTLADGIHDFAGRRGSAGGLTR